MPPASDYGKCLEERKAFLKLFHTVNLALGVAKLRDTKISESTAADQTVFFIV